MSGNHRWKPQDDDDLIHLMGSGFAIESVAWALDRTPVAVRARLAQLRRDLTSVEVDGLPLAADADA